MAKPLRNKQVQLIAIVAPKQAGVSTTFTLFKPNGTSTTKIGTTGTDGTATMVFVLNRTKDRPGVYRGRAVVVIGSSTLIAEASVEVL